MKIKTNAGEVELTAEMVCRGMVLQSPAWRIPPAPDGVLTMKDPRGGGDWYTTDQVYCNPIVTEAVLLGCDPTIATRAACERFGVHGDAGAHGFARLRDGGAVDFRREELPNGSAVGFIGGTGRCYSVLRSLTAEERFIGLDARHASPEDVRRLCCGAEETTTVTVRGFAGVSPTGRVCTLAIGDHDAHEDLATGVKWGARKVHFYDRVDIHLDGKPLRENLYPSRLAALAEGMSGDAGGLYVPALPGPRCGRCVKPVDDGPFGPMMLRLPVDEYFMAQAPVCQACLAEVNKDVGAWTIRDGKIERKTEWPGLDIVSGKALDRLALLYDEKRRAGETCEDLRARLRRIHARGPGFRVSAAMRKAGESLAAVGEAAKRAAESAMLAPSRCPCDALGRGAPGLHTKDCKAGRALKWEMGTASLGQSQAHILRDGDVYRWQVNHLGLRIRDGVESHAFDAHAAAGRILFAVHDATAGIEWLAEFFGLLFRVHDSTPAAMRAKQEAPLVALVAAVPEGLDPIGWRAAVLAVCEKMTPQDWQDDQTGEWLQRCALCKESPDGRHPASLKVVAWTAYHRAISPAPKVPRVRATWKTRGPVLPCDNGEDE